MNWNNVKTLLIVLLLAANVFFGALLVLQKINTDYIREETVDHAITLLRKSGIGIEKDAVPRAKNQNRFAVGHFDDSYYEQTVSAITDDASYVTRTTVNGMIVQLQESKAVFEFIEPFAFFYENGSENGALVKEMFASDSFVLPFSETEEKKTVLSQKQEKAMERFLLGVDETGGYELSLIGLYEDADNGFVYAKAEQKRSGSAIGVNEAICVFDGDALVYAEGNWIFRGIDEAYTVDLYDQIDALFFEKQYAEQNVSEWNESVEIASVESHYSLFWNNLKTEFYLVPSWKILYTGGEERIYNAVNGNLYTK